MSNLQRVNKQEMKDFMGIFTMSPHTSIRMATKVIVKLAIAKLTEEGNQYFTTKNVRDTINKYNIINWIFLRHWGRVSQINRRLWPFNSSNLNTVYLKHALNKYVDRIQRHIEWNGYKRTGGKIRIGNYHYILYSIK